MTIVIDSIINIDIMIIFYFSFSLTSFILLFFIIFIIFIFLFFLSFLILLLMILFLTLLLKLLLLILWRLLQLLRSKLKRTQLVRTMSCQRGSQQSKRTCWWHCTNRGNWSCTEQTWRNYVWGMSVARENIRRRRKCTSCRYWL